LNADFLQSLRHRRANRRRGFDVTGDI